MNPVAYLNDHLAGSVAAVELLEHLAKNSEDESLGIFYEALRRDITADQEELRALLKRVGTESTMRKAAAWLVEKILRIKVQRAGEDFGDPGLLEALEVLALGITGKGLLWKALRHSLTDSPLLAGIDLARLEKRAAEQFQRVEELRLGCARRVLEGLK